MSSLNVHDKLTPDERAITCQDCAKKQLEIDQLRKELEGWQSKYKSLEDENERQKDELQTLESEIEEMHDNFREEESEQFEQLKQELDVSMKNCKILQIKLNKSERRYNQLEQVKLMLEKQLLEQQQTFQNQQNKPGLGQNNSENNPLDQEDCIKIRSNEYKQLMRDLDDINERERDLQEQIRYSQEEAQLKGERLQAVESENEVLLNRINKLTDANSSLRSTLLTHQRADSSTSPSQQRSGGSKKGDDNQQETADDKQALVANRAQFRELIEQNEQLRLALELAQAESERLQKTKSQLQNELNSLKDPRGGQKTHEDQRPIRNDSHRAIKQTPHPPGQGEAQSGWLATPKSTPGQNEPGDQCCSSVCSGRFTELNQRYEEILRRSRDLESRIAELTGSGSTGSTGLELDLVENLKKQLDLSESELAKARSRLVELDIECSKAQREHKRLLESFESCGSSSELQMILARKQQLPSESMRDTMSRGDLRQALRGLESDLDELASMVRAKDCLMRENLRELNQLRSAPSGARLEERLVDSGNAVGGHNKEAGSLEEQQLKGLRRILEQEQLLSNNLKLDVVNLEQECKEFQKRSQMLERERGAMEEELEKLRKLVGELRAELEESQEEKIKYQTKTRDLNETIANLRSELDEAKRISERPMSNTSKVGRSDNSESTSSELLILNRDLSELKVKNGFLMRQLELTRDESQRQMEELRESHEMQLKRATEMAQLEMKEKHLPVEQQFRDEIQELKQNLANTLRQLQRNDEELASERDRTKTMEREWRRDKSQWQQIREQLEGQLSMEKRSNEFKLKEVEASLREKERTYISLQDKCVQLERDHRRLQNKYQLLREDYEGRLKSISRELENKSKELSETKSKLQTSETQTVSQLRKLAEDNKTLSETLAGLRQSYESKHEETKQLSSMLRARGEQTYKERQQNAEQVADLVRRLNEAQESEVQAKLLRQRIDIQERQLESIRKESTQLREERARLKTRCAELEKRELIARTNTISASMSTSSSSFLRPFVGQSRGRANSPSRNSPVGLQKYPTKDGGPPSPSKGDPSSGMSNNPLRQGSNNRDECCLSSQDTIENLSGKINDQRNLIQMLKQQLVETQLELKQTKVLQASERSKWQTRVAILTSRLNECEEKLAFEMSWSLGWLPHSHEENRSQVSASRRRSGASLDGSQFSQTVKPQLELQFESERQANLELLQQQQAQIDSLVRDMRKINQAHDLLRLQNKQLESSNNKLSRKLIEYQQQQPLANLAHQELENRHERVTLLVAKLRAEIKPLVEIVGKMVASLDAPEQQQITSEKVRSAGSTQRPLRPVSVKHEESEEEDDQSQLDSERQSRPSRLSRLFSSPSASRAASKTGKSSEKESLGPGSDKSTRETPGTTRKPVRVRIKCSSLGITTTEKKQLKQKLSIVTELLTDEKCTDRLSNEHNDLSQPAHQDHSEPVGGGSLRWQKPLTLNRADSDLDSERSWFLEPAGSSLSTPNRGQNIYRRFPQASPSSRSNGNVGASLTDYESESSLTSDFIYSTDKSRHNNGAESDSGISPGSSRKFTRGRGKQSKISLGGRMANTFRSISKSIQGLGSGQPSGAEEELDTRKESQTKDLLEIRV